MNSQNTTAIIKERDTNRWMMLIYDIIVYIVCWVAFFVFHPSSAHPLPKLSMYTYLFVGFAFYLAARLIFKCYKQILRYGTIGAFSREIAAGILSTGAILGFNHLFGRIPGVQRATFVGLLSFCGVYVIVSLLIRIAYCYLYNFATKDNKVSKFIKRVVEIFGFVDFDSKVPGATLHLALESEEDVPEPINEQQRIAEKFAIRGNITSIKQINKGYINRTYRVKTLSDAGHIHKYTLQRINTNVFPNVDALMENFKLTTNHLFGKFHLSGADGRGSVQTLRTTKDGCSFLKDDSGCWRMTNYLDNVFSLDIPESPEVFYHAGVAFGTFLKEMSDIEPSQIKEVIPNFHNTRSRYLDLEKAIEEDVKGRVKSVSEEIEFIRSRKDNFSIISDALESGRIPKRVCHNDCNLNNILFDNTTRLPVAIIDLDTVMPSSPLYDFGDSMRIGTNTAKDDEKDLSKVSCDLNLYESYARGYLEACGKILTKEELELLPFASLIITAEDGIRFLMDHIQGDTYYNIYYPEQNLDRSRTQLKLLEDMEKKLPEIKNILRKIYSDLNLDAEIK